MDNTTPHTQPRALRFIDNLVHILIDGQSSDGALALLDERGRRGTMPPLHVHRRHDETFYVLEGEVTLFAPGEQRFLTAGQAAFAARDVPHTYRVESDEARWLGISAPAGFDDFGRAVPEPVGAAELQPSSHSFDPASLSQPAAKAGIEILGPPGTLPADLRADTTLASATRASPRLCSRWPGRRGPANSASS